MDASFDAFGAGGWGEQGEQDFNPGQTQRFSMLDKIPMPATISNLQSIKSDEEKYKIDVYSFHTIKTIGKVATVNEEGGTIKYNLMDPDKDDPSFADTFHVVRYVGSGEPSAVKDELFEPGDVLHAIGKLRCYDNTVSLICYHVRKVDNDEEVALFQLQAKIAIQYYKMNIPERNVQQLENLGITMFSGLPPLRPEYNKNGSVQTPKSVTPGRRQMGMQQQTPNNPGQINRKLYQSPLVNNRSDISGQRNRILQFIKINGNKVGGVSIEEIRRTCKLNDNFGDDINFLLGEGVIYNTVDDDHYAVIQS